MNNHLPAGYTSRPASMDDLEGVVAVINAVSRKMFGRDKFTVSEYQTDWKQPAFKLEHDTRLVIDPQGQVAGIIEFWDLNDPHVRYQVWGRVHPEHEGRGIGSHLLEWAVQRGKQSLARAPEGARVVLQSFSPTVLTAADGLFQEHGFRLIRYALRMVIDLNGMPPAPRWPEGIRVRTIRVGEEEADVLRAVRDSFKDHWGFVEAPFEQDLQRWMHMIRNEEHFDPNLWFLAVDGDQIAGTSLCWPKSYEDPEMGWVGTLGVRRPWRRRGLGLALLQHSFLEFHKRGKPRVGLGVDAQSLTGATRLYLKAGMRPDPTFEHALYEMELRPGMDLSTQDLESHGA